MLFEHLQYYGVSRKIIEAMNKIDRKLFVPSELQESAYLDIPLPIGYGQTISAPHMVGMMCEYLELKDGDRVLEIGTGSGYNAAVMSLLVGESGWIYAIERIPELAQEAQKRINLLGIKNITITIGDGKEGFEEYAPFDKITVTCYAKHIPKKLIEQLKDNGIMVIPVGNEYVQILKLIRKSGEKIIEEDLTHVRFVPMQ
ncbi:protein-L-isoaspartate O-methyltransferase [Fervidobacterium riparium]|nr:protein-L-isoaspartate O-methyltransferase [Fervidobacterium riparium]